MESLTIKKTETIDKSFQKNLVKGTSWFALFKVITQMFSWLVTIKIAQILVPADYGLCGMATIITGYAEMFAEMGLGSAIIQRENISRKNLSSVFWFSLMAGIVLACCCFPLATLTSMIMHEPRVIPLTRTVSIIFILTSLQIVPSSLVRKNLDFKSVGLIEAISTIVSLGFMYLLANNGFGVWALITGRIIRAFISTTIYFVKSRWIPLWYFNFKEAKLYLTFGMFVSVSRSLYYVQGKSDVFFAGRYWSSAILGLYSFALELAQIPTNKIVPIINQISFPAFSKLQNNLVEFRKLYLRISKITCMIVFPLFIGGFLVGDQLIRLLFNEKWYPMIPVFKWLCLVQIAVSMNAINSFVHMARGKPQFQMYFQSICTLIMPVCFFVAVQYGFNAIVYPWLIVYVLLVLFWLIVTLHFLKIKLLTYLKNLNIIIIASVLLISCGLGLKILLQSWHFNANINLIISISLGIISYGISMILFEREYLQSLLRIIIKKS